ncbi:MAG: phosphate ABC transporter permease PstA [Planctomycetota bacterium]|jgi:phosphate transport system permease protein|nr:phosphate ABC transporter permease PstA [Planctomycetota bacterium]
MAVVGKNSERGGKIWIALCGAALAAILVLMAVPAYLLVENSLGVLWPGRLERVRLLDGGVFLGRRTNSDLSPEGLVRIQYKVGNRELNASADFRWIRENDIAGIDFPEGAAALTRRERGEFFGFLADNPENGTEAGPAAEEAFLLKLAAYRRRWDAEAEPLKRRLAELGEDWREANLAVLKADYENRKTGAAEDGRLAALRAAEEGIKAESERVLAVFNAAKAEFLTEKAVFLIADSTPAALPLDSIMEAVWPNRLDFFGKLRLFGKNIRNLLLDYPREANTEGGLFPAIFGTVLLVFLMAVSAFPLGVAAGVYIREYAGDGTLSRLARVAVNNLAGVPSIVYGIFGLGFFIYGVGGTLDRLFYPERVEVGVNTFGGGGILWSSLTLGLLTLPVVIVATVEALATVPTEIRQGSLALGATRFQTLWRVILPMASPGILTGFILAMARAAGEVAPLMLTGAVKSAHLLPLDGKWPFAHLERKFMHLGFHIYDMGFQSPNVEAAKPMVYLTALVLLILVFVLNLAAILIRQHMRGRHAMKGF